MTRAAIVGLEDFCPCYQLASGVARADEGVFTLFTMSYSLLRIMASMMSIKRTMSRMPILLVGKESG